MILYFTETEEGHSGNGLKIIYFIQCWPSDVKKMKIDCLTRFWKYYQIWHAEKLSTWLLSSWQDFGKNFLDSKRHVYFKAYFKPSRKKSRFWFLPLSSEPVWLKIHHLKLFEYKQMACSVLWRWPGLYNIYYSTLRQLNIHSHKLGFVVVVSST